MHIHTKDAVDGVSSEITSVPQRLAAIGVETPPLFLTAIREGQWPISKPDLSAEVRALNDATTEPEWQSAVQALATAQARSVVIAESVELRTAVTAARSKRVLTAFAATADEMLDAVVSRYNEDTAEFSTAAAGFPDDLNDVQVLNLTESATKGLRTANVVASRLSLAFDAYKALTRAMRCSDPGTPAVAKVGKFPDASALVKAQNLAAEHGAYGSPYRPFSPHYAVIAAGGTLQLARPDDVESRYRALYAEYVVEVPAKRIWG